MSTGRSRSPKKSTKGSSSRRQGVSRSALKLKVLPSGATRTTKWDSTRYDLISPHALKRLAQRCALGVARHGERNWEKGIENDELINHLLGHLNAFLSGDTADDHLAALAWNAMALLHFDQCPKSL